MNRFSQLQSAGQSYRPGGRRQEFATKLAFGAKLAENTKLTETPLCPLCLFLNSLIRSLRAIYAIGIRGSNPVILSNSFESLCLCAYLNSASSAFSAVNEIFFVPTSQRVIYVPIRHYKCRESSTNQPFFTKQTQFPKGQNERKIACRKIWPHQRKTPSHNLSKRLLALWDCAIIRTVKKATILTENIKII